MTKRGTWVDAAWSARTALASLALMAACQQTPIEPPDIAVPDALLADVADTAAADVQAQTDVADATEPDVTADAEAAPADVATDVPANDRVTTPDAPELPDAAPEVNAADIDALDPPDADIDAADIAPEMDVDADVAQEGDASPPCSENPELCNGLDDNCNGLVDEGLPGLPSRPRRVILFIADGMGFAQVEAARIYANGGSTPLGFETFPHQGQVSTLNYDGFITDSAAGATAMATGRKVDNKVISRAIPGDGRDVTSVAEEHARLGRRVGLVTTHTPMTDATPAAFGAHADSRNDKASIASDYLTGSRPHVLMGLSDSYYSAEAALASGYAVATNPNEFEALDLNAPHVAGAFATVTDTPSLADMTLTALEVLDQEPEGFFLMVEHEGTDTAGHANDLPNVVAGLLEISAAVDAAATWAQGKDDVLIVFTADHETGGMLVDEPTPQAGTLPQVVWSTGGHSIAPIPIYALGMGADQLANTIDNTDIYALIAPWQRLSISDGVEDTTLRQGLPGISLGAEPTLDVDGDDPGGSGWDAQTLIAFSDLSSIPSGAVVAGAHLTLTHLDGGNPLSLHAMLQPWSELTTWSALGGDGITADGVEAVAMASDLTDTVVGDGQVHFDVTGDVVDRLSGTAPDYGWAVLPTGTAGVTMHSSEANADGPSLTVDLTCGLRSVGFGQGVDGYQGTIDTVLSSASPSSPTPDGSELIADGGAAPAQFLLRFDDIIGDAPHQVPADAKVISARLVVTTTAAGDGYQLHRLLVTWDVASTYESLGDGIQLDDVEAAATPTASAPVAEGPGRRHLDVTADVRAWLANPTTNHGWLGVTAGTGQTVASSEGAEPPRLVIAFQ